MGGSIGAGEMFQDSENGKVAFVSVHHVGFPL